MSHFVVNKIFFVVCFFCQFSGINKIPFFRYKSLLVNLSKSFFHVATLNIWDDLVLFDEMFFLIFCFTCCDEFYGTLLIIIFDKSIETIHEKLMVQPLVMIRIYVLAQAQFFPLIL